MPPSRASASARLPCRRQRPPPAAARLSGSPPTTCAKEVPELNAAEVSMRKPFCQRVLNSLTGSAAEFRVRRQQRCAHPGPGLAWPKRQHPREAPESLARHGQESVVCPPVRPLTHWGPCEVREGEVGRRAQSCSVSKRSSSCASGLLIFTILDKLVHESSLLLCCCGKIQLRFTLLLQTLCTSVYKKPIDTTDLRCDAATEGERHRRTHSARMHHRCCLQGPGTHAFGQCARQCPSCLHLPQRSFGLGQPAPLLGSGAASVGQAAHVLLTEGLRGAQLRPRTRHAELIE